MFKDKPEVIDALKKEAMQFNIKNNQLSLPSSSRSIPRNAFINTKKVIDVQGSDTYSGDQENSRIHLEVIAPFVAIIQDTGTEIGEYHRPTIHDSPDDFRANLPA